MVCLLLIFYCFIILCLNNNNKYNNNHIKILSELMEEMFEELRARGEIVDENGEDNNSDKDFKEL